MNEPALVRDGVRAMRDAVSIPVTVKHRIGIDRVEDYSFVRDFVGTVAEGGATTFIVHARNAWLKGLSPRENREVPPLRHESVYRLKQDFPHLTLVLNGGVTTDDGIEQHLQHVDGVMLGRQPYHHPWSMAGWDARFFGDAARATLSRDDVEAAMASYMAAQQAARQVPWSHIARHCMGLWNGTPGARRWRQVWSDAGLKALSALHVQQQAAQARSTATVARP